ncbi:MAG: SO_0444 family Cu/Zn efflux transporter, partial [Muribaculaceae bacterium]|nr:SO_0444 family Cu/Zn efflux transporter [Muribaculaceae bacterium]
MTTLQHFIYPLVGILVDMAPYILLGFLFAGVLHTFITPAMMQRHLSGSGWGPVVKAALFGVPLPLCSCGVLPTAVALRKQGASAGAATSFLIATPQTGVDSIAATYSLLGGPFAVLRPVAALVGAVAGGYAVDRSCSHDQGAPAAHETAGGGEAAAAGMPLGRRVREALRFGFVDMVRSVGKWLVIGLVIAAAVTVFLPDDILVALNDYPLLAMLAMVAIAIPMYVCATGSIPIALSLMMKGLSPGVAFVLLMAGPAANFASVIILRRSLGTMATAIYIAAVTVTAIAFGLLIHYLLPGSWFIPGAGSATAAAGADCHLHLPLFSTVCAGVLVALGLNAA